MVQGHIADMALDVDASGPVGLSRGVDQGFSGAAACEPRGGDGEALFHRTGAAASSTGPCNCMAATACGVGETVEALYRDIRALRIYEGASDVQRVIIARADHWIN